MSRCEAGDIVGGWIIKLALIMALIGLVGYEVISTAVTAVTVDGAARDVARAAATGYRDSDGVLARANEAATAQAFASGVQVANLVVDGDVIVVTVNDQAPTVLIHKIGFLEDLTTPAATARHKWRL